MARSMVGGAQPETARIGIDIDRSKDDHAASSTDSDTQPTQKKSKCVHGRVKRLCKDCGGSGICSHGRQKNTCKECGGPGICPHGRVKSRCKECGGRGICPHGRLKQQCKECGGSMICAHGRQKYTCKGCGGSALCPHGRQKSRCKECGGSAICPHGRRKSRCKECSRSVAKSFVPYSVADTVPHDLLELGLGVPLVHTTAGIHEQLATTIEHVPIEQIEVWSSSLRAMADMEEMHYNHCASEDLRSSSLTTTWTGCMHKDSRLLSPTVK